MRKQILCWLLMGVFAKQACAQTISITDSTPYEINGLKIGYHILSSTTKEVGDKGNFSRYGIQFYVTNTTGEAKVILYKQGFIFNSDNPKLVQFNCMNATGARLTTKESTIQANDCNTLADVEDKDCATNKTTHSKRFVKIGYWIKAGETIANKGIVIVPLNQLPDMKIRLLYANSLFGTLYNESSNNSGSFSTGDNFVKLKNTAGNVYLNNEAGPVTAGVITNGWWSAQWQIAPVPNTHYYVIKNRFKNIFLNNDALSGFSSLTDQPLSSMWLMEASNNPGVFLLKNAGNNAYLTMINGALQTSTDAAALVNGTWIEER